MTSDLKYLLCTRPEPTLNTNELNEVKLIGVIE